MILAIFHLHVNLLLVSFNLYRLVVCEMSKNRFSRWRLWRPSWISDRHSFSSVWSRSRPLTTEQVSIKGLGRDVENWFSRWLLWRTSWTFGWLGSRGMRVLLTGMLRLYNISLWTFVEGVEPVGWFDRSVQTCMCITHLHLSAPESKM